MDLVPSRNAQFWKTRSHSLEKRRDTLQQQNLQLSQKNEEYSTENARLAELVQVLQNKLKILETESPEASKRNPNFNAEQPEHDLFYTFPEEVWPFILVYVQNSSDLLNLSEASPQLGSLLLTRHKPVWLFDQLLPLLWKWLPIKDILTCRLVCKKWTDTLQSYLESPCPTLSHVTPPVWQTRLEPLDFDNLTRLNDCIREATFYDNAYGKSLIFHRALKFGLDNIEENNNNNALQEVHNFWSAVPNLLRLMGPEIWHVEFYNDGFEDEAASFYTRLQLLLCSLPNLKTLRIICEFENAFLHDHDLANRQGTWPLPFLPHLEIFHVVHSVPHQMAFGFFSSYGRQLRKLVVSVAILRHVEEEYLRGFVSLSELVLRDCVKETEEFHTVLRKLEELRAPNLQRLRLFRSYTDQQVISVGYVAELQQLFPQLRELDTYKMTVVNGGEATSPAEWRGLKSLKVMGNQRALSLENLLKKFPSLEALGIRGAEQLPENAAEEKLDSIWKLLPKLKCLAFENGEEQHRTRKCRRFTREMYEYALKKKQQESQI